MILHLKFKALQQKAHIDGKNNGMKFTERISIVLMCQCKIYLLAI